MAINGYVGQRVRCNWAGYASMATRCPVGTIGTVVKRDSGMVAISWDTGYLEWLTPGNTTVDWRI
jgi:hypothetical protein